MAIEVFNRYEEKYLLDQTSFLKLKEEIEEKMTVDKYNQDGKFYPIYNIYLDTEDNYFIRKSLDKPDYKEKVRLRSYEGFDKEYVYLEVKKKYLGKVNKRRTYISQEEARQFIETGQKPSLKSYMNQQVIEELAYLFKSFRLMPKVSIYYERMAYFDEESNDLRITFDKNIRGQRDNKEYIILDDSMVLMEVKASQSFPMWVSQLLSKYQLYGRSFSKYGQEYLSYISNKEEVHVR